MKYNFNFAKFFKKFNLMSIVLTLISLLLIILNGLNYGIDFKGGTLLEIRLDDKNTKISSIRDSLSNLDLGDVSVKNFGEDGDFIIKIEKKVENNNDFISTIKSSLDQNLNQETNLRRVESVGPKVSEELLKSGLISIGLALLMMLIYIWFRFEGQFSLG